MLRLRDELHRDDVRGRLRQEHRDIARGRIPTWSITVGFLLADDTLAAADRRTPTSKFIGIDQFQRDGYPDNYIGVLFNEDEGGYMAGVLAASLSESGVIGVVGGREDVPPVVKLVNGYETGAKSVNPDIKVLSIYNESFTDPDKGASDAQQFMGEGADVIFGAGGKTGSGGVVEAATTAGKWGIGVDQDEYFTTFDGGDGPGRGVPRHLGREARRPRRVPQDRGGARRLVRGRHLRPRPRPTAASPTRRSTTRRPRRRRRQVEETRKGLADGSIKTGLDPATGLPK